MLKTIFDVWYSLSETKKIQSRTVLQRVPKESLSPESLQDPAIRTEVDQFGYHDIAIEFPKDWIGALDFLSDLGYLEKRKDTIYHISYLYQAYPYEPYVSPFGWVGITNNSTFVSSIVNVDSKHIKAFTETANELKRQISDNQHRHITQFEYGISFSYDTIVYEIKDKYFDAITLTFSLTEPPKLLVYSCESYVESDGKTDKKHIKKINPLGSEIFLKGSSEFDKIFEIPEWKEKSIGIIIHDKKSYFLVIKRQDILGENKFFNPPNFFDENILSKENALSRLFENAVATHISTKYGYQIRDDKRKPPYLDSRQIDIFAEKGVDPKYITVCECKLRFKNQPLTMSELEYFNQKILKIREHEGKETPITFCFQFISNTDNLEEGVKEFAIKNKIEIKKAHLPHNWEGRVDWTINEMMDL